MLVRANKKSSYVPVHKVQERPPPTPMRKKKKRKGTKETGKRREKEKTEEFQPAHHTQGNKGALDNPWSQGQARPAVGQKSHTMEPPYPIYIFFSIFYFIFILLYITTSHHHRSACIML